MVLLEFHNLVLDDHFAETETVLALSVGQVSKGIFTQQIGSVFVRHKLLRGREVMLVKLLYAI